VLQPAAPMPAPTTLTRASLPAPNVDEAAAAPPPLPTPATLEIVPASTPPSNGLTVQPVLMNPPPPTKVRPQSPK
jgi:hypothetical protein